MQHVVVKNMVSLQKDIQTMVRLDFVDMRVLIIAYHQHYRK